MTFPAAAQVTADLGVFAGAGWADGNLEPWDFTDIDGTVQAGVSFSGKQCGRPNDRVGIENEQIKAFAPHWEEGRIADRGSLAAHTHGFRIFIEPLGQ